MNSIDDANSARSQQSPGPGSGPGLPADLYLLACDLTKGKVSHRDTLGYVVRAAVLVELSERGCLADDNGRARKVGDRRTGEPLLDDVLRAIEGESRPKKWKALVERRRKQTLDAVEEHLESARALSFERRFLLADKVEVRDTGTVKRLQAEAVETLNSTLPAEQFTPRQAALVAFAALGQLPSVASGKERRQHKKCIKELTLRAGDAGPALKKALDSKRAATAAAASSAGAAGA